jgi:nicotinate-nucleotide adenylyltransferase
MKKILLIGGAFDPITIGHLSLAEMAMKNTDADEAWFLPCYESTWGKEMAPPQDRLNMIRMSVTDTFSRTPCEIKVCGFEIENRLTGHTFDILGKFVAEYPPDEFDLSFLIGMDHANVIHTWGSGENLIKKFKFVVSERKGVKRDESVDWYLKPPHLFIPGATEVSSTMARKEIKEKGETSLVTESVMRYVKKTGLYQ